MPNSDRVEILQQPLPTAVAAGQTARFAVTAGGAPPVNFQWRRNGTPLADGPGIVGTATGTLTITRANPLTDAGGYDVVISNDCGSTTSATAALAFSAPSLSLGLTSSPGALSLNWSAPNTVLQSASHPHRPLANHPGRHQPLRYCP